jgi:hypothetical protein
MGELFDAIKLEAEKCPSRHKFEERLKEFLGEASWKDYVKACKDPAINNAVIHRVIKNKGFKISYSALSRMRQEIAKA